MVASKKPVTRHVKQATVEKKSTTKPRAVGEGVKTITIDRRDNPIRRGFDRRQHQEPVAVERRAKVNRRRQIDPTTCERDYTADEVEFMSAMDQYKRRSGRMFPTCSEVLEVIRSLGYEKRPQPTTSEPVIAAPIEVTTTANDFVTV